MYIPTNLLKCINVVICATNRTHHCIHNKPTEEHILLLRGCSLTGINNLCLQTGWTLTEMTVPVNTRIAKKVTGS